MKDKSEKTGIVYLAFGYEYFLMAAHSANTAKASNPGIECEIITNVRFNTDVDGGKGIFDKVTYVMRDSAENRYIKTNIIEYTDLDYAVYIDGDTEVRGSLTPIFKCLENFDLAIKMCPKPTRKEYEVAPGVPSHLFPEWNGGVIFFRRNRAARHFFRTWNEIYRREGKNRDQPALACALYSLNGGARLLSLTAAWNAFRSDLAGLPDGVRSARIWHYRMAEKYPQVAPQLYRLHKTFHEEVSQANPSMMEEVKELENRYAFLSSRAYRASCWHPRLRAKLISAMRLLMTVGVVSKFNLARNPQVAGESYAEIGRDQAVKS